MRYSRKDLDALVEKLNKRFEKVGTSFRYTTQSRNGYTAVDLAVVGNTGCLYGVGTGTPKECAFHVMEHALDTMTDYYSLKGLTPSD